MYRISLILQYHPHYTFAESVVCYTFVTPSGQTGSEGVFEYFLIWREPSTLSFYVHSKGGYDLEEELADELCKDQRQK